MVPRLPGITVTEKVRSKYPNPPPGTGSGTHFPATELCPKLPSVSITPPCPLLPFLLPSGVGGRAELDHGTLETQPLAAVSQGYQVHVRDDLIIYQWRLMNGLSVTALAVGIQIRND